MGHGGRTASGGRVYARFEDSGYGYYRFRSTPDQGLIAALKAKVATHLRQWDPNASAWMLDPSAVLTVAGLVKQHLGIDVPVPPVAVATSVASTRFFRVIYVGSPKYREDGSYTATAYCEDEYGRGEWKLVIPVGVLRDHFEGVLKELFEETGTEDEWAVIGLDREQAAQGKYTVDQIKAAARKAKALAHPDVNKDPDAHERFIKIGEAAETLSSDRGIHFSLVGAREFEKARQKRLAVVTGHNTKQYAYVPPRRTGWMMVEGADLLGGKQVLVSKILGFVDIEDDYGRVLSASIPRGQRTPVPTWVVTP